MQNQLTPEQNSLQQTGSNLQQNSSNLQQSGTPALSSNVFTVLSQDSNTQGLQVQSAQTDPSVPSQTYKPEVSPSVWIIPIVFVISVLAAIALWVKFRKQIEQIAEPSIDQPETAIIDKPKQIVAKAKTGKKTTRRKRQAKR